MTPPDRHRLDGGDGGGVDDPPVPFEKWSATGNDFVVVDAGAPVPSRRAFARRVCDRETGVRPPDGGRVGADGVLFLAPDPACEPPRAVMTLFQPDGGTAPMCGNGARVAAAWTAGRTGADRVMIDTQAGTRAARVEDDGVTIEMGRPSFDPAAVPLARDGPLVDEPVAGLRVTAVDTGVPHAVGFVPDASAVDLDDVAPPVREADVFPDGANVTVASRTPAGFAQRTYERGVEDETRSCGTGAVAIAAVARRLGLADGRVAVEPPGGPLTVDLREEGLPLLRGPVERSYEGEVVPPATPGPSG